MIKGLAIIWFYLYPIVLVLSWLLVIRWLVNLKKNSSFGWGMIDYYAMFFSVFTVILGVYFVIEVYSTSDTLTEFSIGSVFRNFIPLAGSFYFWAYYLTAYFCLSMVLLLPIINYTRRFIFR